MQASAGRGNLARFTSDTTDGKLQKKKNSSPWSCLHLREELPSVSMSAFKTEHEPISEKTFSEHEFGSLSDRSSFPGELKTKKYPRKEKNRRIPPRPGMKVWVSKIGKNLERSRPGEGALASLLDELQTTKGIGSLLDEYDALGSRDVAKLMKEQRHWFKAQEIFKWFQRQEAYQPNVVLYNILFKVLGIHMKWDLIQKYWEEMLEMKVVPTNITYSTLVDVFGRAGQKKQALFYYKHMKQSGVEPDEAMVSTFVNLQRRFGDPKAAEEAFWGLFSGDGDRRPKNPETYNTMIAFYGEQSRFGDASRVFSEMVKANVELTTVTFNTMIYIYGKVGRIEEAELVFRKMEQRDCFPNVATYNCLVDMYAKNGDLQQAHACLERMNKAGVSPDEVTYRTLIFANATGGPAWRAEALIREMESSGFSINHAVYREMIFMHIRAGEASKAEEVFGFMCSRGNVKEWIFIAVMNEFAENGFVDQARNAMSLWVKQGLKSPLAYNVMIKAYGLQSRFDEAFAVFWRMEEEKVKPSESTFNVLVQLSCRARNLELLEKFLVLMKRSGFRLSQYSVTFIIHFYADAGRVKEAEKFFREMVERGVKPDAICFGAMVNAYAEAGFGNEAQELVSKMKAAGFVPDVVLHTSLMKLYGNLGLIGEAEKIYREISSSDPDLFAANTLLDLYIKAGRHAEAEEFFRLMVDGDPGLNEISCTMMLRMYSDTGMLDKGVSLASFAERQYLLKDNRIYNQVISVYARAGLMKNAFLALQSMKEAGIPTTEGTFSCFEEALEKAGMARELVRRLDFGGSNLETMIVLAPLYAQAGMMGEAESLALQIFNVRREEERNMDVNAYNAMIFTFGRVNRVDLALRMYGEMKARGVEANEATYGSVIYAYGKAGLLEGVGRMFRKLKERGFQPSALTYKTVIDIYREAGRRDLAGLVSQELHFSQFVRGGMQTGDENDHQQNEELSLI